MQTQSFNATLLEVLHQLGDRAGVLVGHYGLAHFSLQLDWGWVVSVSLSHRTINQIQARAVLTEMQLEGPKPYEFTVRNPTLGDHKLSWKASNLIEEVTHLVQDYQSCKPQLEGTDVRFKLHKDT